MLGFYEYYAGNFDVRILAESCSEISHFGTHIPNLRFKDSLIHNTFSVSSKRFVKVLKTTSLVSDVVKSEPWCRGIRTSMSRNQNLYVAESEAQRHQINASMSRIILCLRRPVHRSRLFCVNV